MKWISEIEIDKENEMDSNIEIELQINTTFIENGIQFYSLIIINENQEITLSEPFTLISYKQLMKKKEKSFHKKQEDYMLNGDKK